LESISEKTGVSVETIMALNDLAPDALLPVGDRIFIGWQDDLDPLSTEMPGEINAPHFPRQQPGLDQMEAILEGKLIVANGCLRIESFDAPISYLPIWPNGYGLGISSNEIKIADDTGEMIVARVGEGVSMGGGELLSLDGLGEITLQQIPGNCSGPYWLVGAGTHIIPLAPTLFRSEANHLEVTVPDGWAAYEGEEYLASPFTGVVAFNSWGEQGFWVKEKVIQTQSGQSFAYNPNVVLDQIPQDGAYIVLVWQTGGPAISEPGTLNAEYPGSDLSGLWKAGDCREHIGQYLDFYKFERIFRLEIYCGPQASDATVEAANSLLSSWRFDNSQSELSNPQPPTPLTLESDSETIRQRILLSHTFW
ncbi:MAG TPA: LysM peptidoglycan-binding domain-containing protein, partial [Anaerolineales bacterium]|nr:LysM peptidoglycan-binding domain-containing protein [Anaerolineales bacterium]